MKAHSFIQKFINKFKSKCSKTVPEKKIYAEIAFLVNCQKHVHTQIIQPMVEI